MIEPPIPADEEFRLLALRALSLLDSPPDPAFDDIVAMGRVLFGVETCLVSLIDADRQWFKARSGLDASETPRGVSFCGHAILGRQTFVIANALDDERFHDNPLVTGAPHIRFYAGAPIWLPSGYPIGTVCLLDPEPNPDFGPERRAMLETLARAALNAVTVGALRDRVDVLRAEGDRLRAALDGLDRPLAVLDANGVVCEANLAFASLCPEETAIGLDLARALGIAEAILPAPGETAEIRLDGLVLSLHAGPDGVTVGG